MKKQRLDLYLSEKGLSASREKAKREILAGWVKVNGETIRTASYGIAGDEDVSVERPGGLFVSRGGYKLARALDFFSINLHGVTAADLGASTGGFTDCMLRAGASRVYSIDVGYGQLDYSLRQDPRVTVMDRTNARYLEPGMFDPAPEFIAADLSFISITKVFPAAAAAFPGASGVFLIKPQFEAMKSEQKKGVVRDRKLHSAIVTRVIANLASQGALCRGITWSPVKGPAGNIEFLLYFDVDTNLRGLACSEAEIEAAVDDAHINLSE